MALGFLVVPGARDEVAIAGTEFFFYVLMALEMLLDRVSAPVTLASHLRSLPDGHRNGCLPAFLLYWVGWSSPFVLACILSVVTSAKVHALGVAAGPAGTDAATLESLAGSYSTDAGTSRDLD
ncbi:MAG TPA: hypothetical protein DER07_03940 [Armatimonadetes bacterium]|nr:hypothetical protein [Armatimonadota bacterium]